MSKIKRVFTLCLILLLSINSFATSISNNDGSAFITKAEFDALKSSFQAQIDTYNQNIDSKIDNAIASYLSGIKISNETILNSNYDNNWFWNNSSDASFDKINAKKFWYTADFYFRTGVSSNGYENHQGFVPVVNKLWYETLEIDEIGVLDPVKLCFRCEAILHFGRGDSNWNDPGGIRWIDFWPSNNKAGEVVTGTATHGVNWWYTGMTFVTIDYENGYKIDTVIYPQSTGTTYYYKANEILMKAKDKGAQYDDYDSTHYINRRVPAWSKALDGTMMYYPNQTLSSDSNKNIVTNNIILSYLREKSEFNNEMKYGIHLCNIDALTGDKIIIKITPQDQGTLKFAIGDDASDAWLATNTQDKWDYVIKSTDVSKETSIEHQITTPTVVDKKLFMIYIPQSLGNQKINIQEIKKINTQ